MRRDRFLKWSFLLFVIGVILSPTFTFAFGPYTGVVVDRLTGAPVEGASVLYYRTRSYPQFEGHYTVTVEVRLVYTDNGGRYEIPNALFNFNLFSLESESVLIYQPGYQVYMAGTGIYHAGREEVSFQERGHRVRLERGPPAFNHRRHVDEIERVLGTINNDYREPGAERSWDWMLEKKLIGEVEKREFLRRIRWEEERGREEERRDP